MRPYIYFARTQSFLCGPQLIKLNAKSQKKYDNKDNTRATWFVIRPVFDADI